MCRWGCRTRILTEIEDAKDFENIFERIIERNEREFDLRLGIKTMAKGQANSPGHLLFMNALKKY